MRWPSSGVFDAADGLPAVVLRWWAAVPASRVAGGVMRKLCIGSSSQPAAWYTCTTHLGRVDERWDDVQVACRPGCVPWGRSAELRVPVCLGVTTIHRRLSCRAGAVGGRRRGGFAEERGARFGSRRDAVSAETALHGEEGESNGHQAVHLTCASQAPPGPQEGGDACRCGGSHHSEPQCSNRGAKLSACFTMPTKTSWQAVNLARGR